VFIVSEFIIAVSIRKGKICYTKRMNVTQKKIAIIGYGVVGKSATRYVVGRKGLVTVFDRQKEDQLPQGEKDFLKKEGIIFMGGLEEAEDLTGFDALVSSPGISRYRKDIVAAEKAGVPVYTDITLFLECWKGSGKIIGVTGSNGKSTVVSLFDEALKASGNPVLMGGNIGNSPLEWLDNPAVPQDATIVLELSSYMLEYFKSNHVLDISVIISFSQNHLSRHGTLEEYARVKTAGIKEGETHVYLGDTQGIRDSVVPSLGKLGIRKMNFVDLKKAHSLIEDISGVKMLGEHNLINIGLVMNVLQDLELFDIKSQQALNNYTGLSHRIEFVREIACVRWINDSKSTSPDATIKALEAIAQPSGKIVLIAGGVDKGVTYESWRIYLDPEKVVLLILLPGPAEEELTRIARDQHIDFCLFETEKNTETLMEKVVACAQSKTKEGDTVLLSPGAASLNLWGGFEARGDDFVKAVMDL